MTNQEATKKLNEKQIAFLRRFFLTKNRIDSYISVFETESRETAKVNAHKILQKEESKAYLSSLDGEIEELVSVSKAWMLEQLKKIIESEAETELTTAERLKAMDLMSKILGYNAPEKQKVEITGKGAPFKVKFKKKND